MEFRNVINPARFYEVVGQVPMYTATDVDRVLSQAQAAFKIWSRTAPEERASCLRAAAGKLRDALPGLVPLFVRENGKPIREAEVDIRRSIELMELIGSDLAGWWKPTLVERGQPVWARRRARGVTAVISPWNSPVLLSLKRVAPAIAAGNTVVLKPATYCPLTIMRCAELINECIPAGVLGVVTGNGSTVGEMLAADERVRAIAFTGSTETGQRIMELGSRTVKKFYMELGGNDPALVLADATLDSAGIERMKNAILRAAGQVCIAIKRIYVHQSRYRELTEKLSDAFDQVIAGDGLVPETTMGPLNNKPQFEFVKALIERCRSMGLNVSTHGRKLDAAAWAQGFFLLPSIVLGAGPQQEIVQCEQFGPIIPIVAFENEDDAITRANDTPYGLRASVWTTDRARAEEIADRLEAGAVFWNNHGIFHDLHLEFPGIKQSGFSRESRTAALDHYVDTYGFAE
jgi:acyl-CoA reductase-like NAD-dependent aldehyde dehydrogenase